MKANTKAEDELGDWFVAARDPKTGETADVRVRRMPADLARKHRQKTYKIKGNTHVIDLDREELRQRNEAIDLWTGARNFGFAAENEAQSKAYAALVPGTEFPVGKEVIVDKLLTDEFKRRFLTDYPEYVNLIRSRSRRLQGVVDDEEEDLTGN